MMRLLVVVSVLSCLLPRLALAAPTCDPDLKIRGDDPLGYRARGDRCEGMFVEEVSGTIRVASLHFPRGDFQPRAGTRVSLAWSLPSAPQVRVQAVSLRPRVFFRMDAVRPGNSTSYLWPTDFAERIGLTSADIGLLSWVELPIGSAIQRIYSPVSVKDRSGEPEVVLVPEARLDELYYSLVKINAQGRAQSSIVSDRPLKEGPYPADRPIKIKLPRLDVGRIYRLEIGAALKWGGAMNRDVYIVNYSN